KPLSSRKALMAAEYIGIYEKRGDFGRVIPDDRRDIREILIPQGSENGAGQGDRVVARLSPAGFRYNDLLGAVDMVGRVTEVLGAGGDLGVAEKALIRRLGLRQAFSSEQLAAAKRRNKPVGEKEREGRLDLRQELLLTIDGEDARDLDDAVSLRREGAGWRLGVHIADVSHYVKEGTLLDQEAYARGTSVYFPDLVLPMLPPELSNGICSLNEGEDRLAISCLMSLDDKGRVTAHEIRPSIIRVSERLNYTQVQDYLNSGTGETKPVLYQGGAAPPFQQEGTAAMLNDMAELSEALRRNRMNRGALDFELPECQIVPGPDGRAMDLKRKERMLSESIIEECMIIANETVALQFQNMDIPFPYRVHGKPGAEKLAAVQSMLEVFGFHMDRKPSGSQTYQQFLKKVKGNEEETLVSTLLLRSMDHAYYSVENQGHFGLASDCYCHFTAPIRRYPDLMVHRIIKQAASGSAWTARQRSAQASGDAALHPLRAKTEEKCREASLRERIAEEAERRADSLWKADYMSRFVGEAFDGVISGVTDYALFVALENTAEGMLHISRLDGYFEYAEGKMALISDHRQKQYRLGDPIRVRLESVDIGLGRINFTLDENG
ncbi:MAG: ribonuclease R, partial [Clostridiales bacterium]|nr:ribonuclease R [Clostridiales bacterium]